ncbi:hypothetical protein [Glaciecola sp. SC05]|uniref:hypothetical protein n=1 Tax=Glaciecola sp. SC05 TaxID=1987355 RepID=UPI0035281B63
MSEAHLNNSAKIALAGSLGNYSYHMKNVIQLVLLCLMSISSNAAFADETLHVGFGYEFGGVIGAKYNFKREKDNYFVSIGLLGGAAGYQYLTDETEQHAFGIMGGAETLSSENGFLALSYHYYAKGFTNDGWVIGASLGFRRTDEDPLNISGLFGVPSETETKALVGISIGFTFD